jgi:MFS family permease
MCSVVTITSAPLLVLAPVFAEGIFGRGSVGLGLMTASLGCGAIGGAIGLARRGSVTGLADVVRRCAMLLGCSLAAVAAAPSFLIAALSTAVVGFAVFRQNASANTLIQTRIAEEYRGRVMALYSMVNIGLLPIGSILAGWLAEIAGPRWTVAAGGAGCLVGALLFKPHWAEVPISSS